MVWDALKQLNDSEDFKLTKADSDIFGTVASLKTSSKKGSQYIGTICIQERSHQWRGSDESPEQTCYDTNLVLRHYVNGDSGDLICVSSSYEELEQKHINDFMKCLAEYLSKEVY